MSSLLTQTLAVATGGAAGSLLRWRVAQWLNPDPWPQLPIALGTLAVNVVGGFLIGVALMVFERVPDETLRLLLVVGGLGGLTTFSSFSAESLGLLMKGQFGVALAHTLLHVLGGLGAAAAGYALARGVMP